jgi:CO/xanthine dehydrogenase Mo-binding subunit
VCVRDDPSQSVPLSDVAVAALSRGGPLSATGSYSVPLPKWDPDSAEGLLFPVFPVPTYHVHLAEVEVDPDDGSVRVTRYVVAQEVGRMINPDGVHGQIQGGVAQGIGYALWEGLESRGGRYTRRTLESYGLPLAVDIPDVEMIVLEHPHEAGLGRRDRPSRGVAFDRCTRRIQRRSARAERRDGALESCRRDPCRRDQREPATDERVQCSRSARATTGANADVDPR